MPRATQASTNAGSAVAANAGDTAAPGPTASDPGLVWHPTPRSTAGWITFQPWIVKSVARPWRAIAASRSSPRRSRNHGARAAASPIRLRSTSFRSSLSLMSAAAPVAAASAAVSDAVCRSVTRAPPARQGRRTGSRRPPCGATSTSGSVPGMTSGRAEDGTAGSLAFRLPTVYMPRMRRPGGCASDHVGCDERSGPCERGARSSLLRRAFRHGSSVVAALPALAPRLVRLARRDRSHRLLAAALALLGCVTRAGALDRPHVYLIVVDGLDARLATPARMPRLSELATHDAEHTSAFLDARAVMPTRTDTNHVSLLTGTYAEAHGITGNAYWSRIPDAAPGRLDAAELIAVETLFTVAETTQPSLVTLGAFSKPKLARLFAAAPDRQRAPDVPWSADLASPAGRDRVTGYSFDSETMDALLAP